MDTNALQKKLNDLNIRFVNLQNLGRFTESIQVAQQAVSIAKALGLGHPDYARSLNNLGLSYKVLGEYERAEPLLTQALQIWKKVLGEDHIDYSIGLNNLAILYHAMGAYEKAEPLFSQSLHIQQKVVGENHPEYANCLSNLAALYKDMGLYEKSESIVKQALHIWENVYGQDHIRYHNSLCNLAVLYTSMGFYEKAERIYQQVLQIGLKVLGEDHPNHAISLMCLASLYDDMGAFEKAESLYKQALQVIKKTFGKNHQFYAQCVGGIAEIYFNRGEYERAEPLFTQGLQILKKVLGEYHPLYAAYLNSLAELYRAMGAYEKAESLYKQALHTLQMTVGENHTNYANIQRNLAELYKFIGAYEKAESLYKQALHTQQKIQGEKHPSYAGTLNNLGALYLHIGAYEKAEPLLKQAIKIDKKVLGEDHSYYATSLNNLAILYELTGKSNKAESLYQQVLKIKKNALGEDHPEYAKGLRSLGFFYHMRGAYEKAEPLYLQVLKIRQKALGEEHPDYATCLYDLATLYVAKGRTNDGLNLMVKAMEIDDKTIGQVFSISSEDQRLAYLISQRIYVDIFVSLAIRFFSHSQNVILTTFSLVLKRKNITAEALAAQRDTILIGKYPHLQNSLNKLTLLRMQIAQKKLSGPGNEDVDEYNRLLTEWIADKERLEQDLARQIPEIKLEQEFRTASSTVIAHILPPGSTLIEFFKYIEYDFTAIPAQGQSELKPSRYCAFIQHTGDPENVSLIDLGEADQIDHFILSYKSKFTRAGRGIPEIPLIHPRNRLTGIFSRLFEGKNRDDNVRSNRDLGTIPENANIDMGRMEGLLLYSALINPLRDILGEYSHLIIAPDGQISTIPLEIIPIPDGGYLIDQFHISYVGVGRDVLRFSAQIPGKPDKSMIMASPDFNLQSGMSLKIPASSLVSGRISRDLSRGSWHFPPLPGTLAEGKTLGKLLGSRPLLEKDALESRVKSLSSPLIFHIATHGFFLTDQESSPDKRGFFGEIEFGRFSGRGIENPMLRSGLALAGANTWLKHGELPPEAEDGILTAEDVSGLDLTNTSLAVLSACETGMGEVKTGEGVFGLRRAFALAGAKTLVMSLWKVPDLATQELMGDFYRRILAGTPKADALREAQLELRKKYPHPRDWGAFICQGDPGVLE